jgi:hypothetical protein
MENNTPTAEEFIISTELVVKFDNTQGCILEEELPNLMIEFAKLHVQAALKEASEKASIIETFGGMSISVVNKNSILNAYPLTLIK